MRFCFYALKNYYKPYNILKKIYEILKEHFPLSHFVFGFEANVNFSSALVAFNEIVVSKKEQEQILENNACALFGF